MKFKHPIFDAGAYELALIRITVFGMWTLIILNTPFPNFAQLPVELYEPVGIYKLLLPSDSKLVTQIILTTPFLFGMKITLLAGCILCAAGFRPFKWIALPTVLLLLLGDAIVKSFNGYVNHSELIVLSAAIILLFAPAAEAWSMNNFFTPSKTEKRYYAAPIFLIAAVLCLSYSFIGLHRLVYGGVEIFTWDTLNTYLAVNTYQYSLFSFEMGIFVIQSNILSTLFKFGFALITLFEILSPLILFNRPFRLVWLWVIIPFHFLSLFTMNIFFWENCLLLFVLFIKKSPE